MVFNYFKNLLCRRVFLRESSAVLPSKYLLGFSTTTPRADGSGISEPAAGSGYARYDITNLLTNVSDGVASNNAAFEYEEALSNWGTFTHSVIFDNSGNALSASALSKPITVATGESIKVKPNAVKLHFGEIDVAL